MTDDERSEIVYGQLAECPIDATVNKEVVRFARKPAVSEFPFRARVDGCGVVVHKHMDIECLRCGKNIETVRRTVIDEHANCIEVWTMAFCLECNVWLTCKYRFYPKENRFLKFANGGWVEWKQPTLVEKLLKMIGLA
jgi:hypothetical protein